MYHTNIGLYILLQVVRPTNLDVVWQDLHIKRCVEPCITGESHKILQPACIDICISLYVV